MRAWGGKGRRGRVVMPQICHMLIVKFVADEFIQTFNLLNGSRAVFNQFSWNSSCIKHLLAKFFLEAKCLGFALDWYKQSSVYIVRPLAVNYNFGEYWKCKQTKWMKRVKSFQCIKLRAREWIEFLRENSANSFGSIRKLESGAFRNS